jgi:hypothetical protein
VKTTTKILGSIAFIGIAVFAIFMTVKFMSTAAELTRTKDMLYEETNKLTATSEQLATTTDQLKTTRDSLTQTKDELISVRNNLLQTTSELTDTKQELSTKEEALTTALTQLSGTELKLSDSVSKLSAAQSQLSVYKTTMDGLGITVHTQSELWNFNDKSWNHSDNPKATNPTWAQLSLFIAQDKTDQHVYNIESYNCVNYATDLHNNAEAAGITSSIVTINWKGETVGHALNAFITSDFGLVYIDCTSKDKVAYLVKDQIFKEVDLGGAIISRYRDATWWSSLTSYYYVISTYYGGSGKAVTASIDIYW